jgi:hypothetical protein
VVGLLLAAVISSSAWLIPTPQEGYGTWYGARTRAVCYGGRPLTCSPYLSKADGGRGGELHRYCAVKGFGFYDKPFWVKITNTKTGKWTTCLVRDYCSCKGGGIIDMSPLVFLELQKNLGLGIVPVRVERIGHPHRGKGGQ